MKSSEVDGVVIRLELADAITGVVLGVLTSGLLGTELGTLPYRVDIGNVLKSSGWVAMVA